MVCHPCRGSHPAGLPPRNPALDHLWEDETQTLGKPQSWSVRQQAEGCQNKGKILELCRRSQASLGRARGQGTSAEALAPRDTSHSLCVTSALRSLFAAATVHPRLTRSGATSPAGQPLDQQLGPGMLCSAQGPCREAELCLQPWLLQPPPVTPTFQCCCAFPCITLTLCLL